MYIIIIPRSFHNCMRNVPHNKQTLERSINILLIPAFFSFVLINFVNLHKQVTPTFQCSSLHMNARQNVPRKRPTTNEGSANTIHCTRQNVPLGIETKQSRRWTKITSYLFQYNSNINYTFFSDYHHTLCRHWTGKVIIFL